jgi:hypothetical protein
MRIRSLRHATAVTTLAVASVAAAAACTATPKPPQPVPTVTAPAGAAPTSAAPTPAPAATTAPVKPVHDPSPPSTGRNCLGTVVHRINAADTGPPWKPLCIAVGGVLRFENLGPDGLTMTARDKVDCGYAAGTFQCRLVQTGTVRFTVTRGDTNRSLNVVITKARSNHGAADPACPRVTDYVLDATDGGPPWPSICMKLNTTLRIVNFGPEGFSTSPAANVSGWYEAGVRQFRFVKTGTVRFTLTYPEGGTRTFTVVVSN